MAAVRLTQAQFEQIERKGKANRRVYPKAERTFFEDITWLDLEAERIETKPRMTQRDKWTRRDRTDRYWGWSDYIKWRYKQIRGKKYCQPIALGFVIRLRSSRGRDLDNIIKGVKDALNRLAWPDDNVNYIRRYDFADIRFLEDKSQNETFKLRIRPLVKTSNGNYKSYESEYEEEEIDGNK